MTRIGTTVCRVGFSLAIGLAALPANAPAAQAPEAAVTPPHHTTPAPTNEDHGATGMAPNMMMMRQMMAANEKEADARLRPLVEKMNAAKGDARIDAMTAVLNELARQRTADRASMGRMSESMPEMRMMMRGMAADMHTHVGQCQMMKGNGELEKQ